MAIQLPKKTRALKKEEEERRGAHIHKRANVSSLSSALSAKEEKREKGEKGLYIIIIETPSSELHCICCNNVIKEKEKG